MLSGLRLNLEGLGTLQQRCVIRSQQTVGGTELELRALHLGKQAVSALEGLVCRAPSWEVGLGTIIGQSQAACRCPLLDQRWVSPSSTFWRNSLTLAAREVPQREQHVLSLGRSSVCGQMLRNPCWGLIV